MWPLVTLNDGQSIPGIAFGSAQRRSDGAKPKSVSIILEAIQSGLRHLDTAQQYGNEEDVGEAIRQSGLARDRLHITTKWSDGNMSPLEACKQSLAALRVDYIDLYVIHHTWTCKGDFRGAWRQMECLKEMGLVRSIGLSAFGLPELDEVLMACTIKPAVNMIMLHPGVMAATRPLLRRMKAEGIVPGGYSPLKPLWDGENKQMLENIARQQECLPEQLLLKWCATQGAIVYTSSATSGRPLTYLDAWKVEMNSAETIEHVYAS